MKVLLINVCCGTGSTGRICTDLATELENLGHEVKIAYGRGSVPTAFEKYAVSIESTLNIKAHGFKARLFDKDGFGSRSVTKSFIQWIEKFDPDVIHLHNLHGYYLNVEVLFTYLKNSKKRVIWTLHDCWAFTGHCTYFDFVGCTKWKSECKKCPNKKEYPTSYFLDNSKQNFRIKRSLFTGLSNMTIVTPSEWLAECVRSSFLSSYNVVIINNGIDCAHFYHKKSNVALKYNIEKKIILGVAAIWNKRKGLNDFIELSKLITDEYTIVLVGLTKEQIETLPSNIVGIERTENVDELACMYSEAEVFLNLTYEDNYPTTNLEALACGTPVITYHTGGSGESVSHNCVVEKGDIKKVWSIIRNHQYVLNEIDVSKSKMIEMYVNLYEQWGSYE